jgi:hypothetical protein
MAKNAPVATQARPQMTVQQANNAAQRLLVQNAVEMTQNIYSGVVYPTSQAILNVVPRNVGIIKKFVVRIVATLQNTGLDEATLTEFGLANLLKNVTFYDLQNNLRINTNGIHLTSLSSVKRRRPYGGCADYNQTAPIVLSAGGDTHTSVSQMFNTPPATRNVFIAEPTIAAGDTALVSAVFEIPLAYSDDDLRGAVFANVVNTTMSLQLTFNADKAFNGTSPTADDTFSVYAGQTGLFTQAQVDIYQVYLDQLPTAQDGTFILPQISLSTVYELKNTMFTSISPNQDFPVPFTNFRDFFSAIALFNFDGTAAGRAAYGVNYWSLTTANFTNVWKYTQDYANLLAREVLSSDLPQGMSYFSFRRHPIWTTQYGNQQINLNANDNATGAAYLQIFWEDMALQNTLVGSASLPAGGM